MRDRGHREVVRVVRVRMEVQVRVGVRDGARGQRADGVQADGGCGGGGCVDRGGDRGSRSHGQRDLGSGRHGDGAGDAETLLLVRLEHVGEAEPLAAHVAGVRLLPRVSSAVPLHVGAAGEAFPTDFTDKGLLSSVCFHVLIKVLFHVEVLATPLAHELLVPDVDAHVGTQLVLVLEPLVAVLASEGFLSRMLQGMDFERHAAFEGFSTGFTCEWHVLGVCNHVFPHVGHGVELFFTNLTREFLFCISVDNLDMFMEGPELLE